MANDQEALLLGEDIFFDGDYSITPAGDLAVVTGLDALRAAIYRRLLTRPGEFKLRPDYGVGVMDFVKKRRTQTTLDALRQRITDQLSLESRIQEVLDIGVERIDDGLKVKVVVRAAGKALTFRPFLFTEAALAAAFTTGV